MDKKTLLENYGDKPLRDSMGILFNYSKSETFEDLRNFNTFLKRNESKKLKEIFDKLLDFISMK